MVTAPRLSKLERAKQAQKAALKDCDTNQSETKAQVKSNNNFQEQSFEEAFGSFKPRKSRLEREKEAATLAKAALEASQAPDCVIQKSAVAKTEKVVQVNDDFWGSVVKKRSRLEADQDRAKATAAAQNEADEEELPTQSRAQTKRRKIEEANDYWKQFGNGDILG